MFLCFSKNKKSTIKNTDTSTTKADWATFEVVVVVWPRFRVRFRASGILRGVRVNSNSSRSGSQVEKPNNYKKKDTLKKMCTSTKCADGVDLRLGLWLG